MNRRSFIEAVLASCAAPLILVPKFEGLRLKLIKEPLFFDPRDEPAIWTPANWGKVITGASVFSNGIEHAVPFTYANNIVTIHPSTKPWRSPRSQT